MRAWRDIAEQISRYQAGGQVDVDKVDAAVAAFGDFAWEIGPYLDTDLTVFALSPGWDRGLLERCRATVAEAPSIDGVLFAEAKPPKEWDRRFSLRTDDGPVDVDCMRIGFQLALRADDNVELSVRLESRLSRWKWDVVNIWVDSEIGERNKILKVVNCKIDTIEQPADVEWGLREMFFHIFPDAPFAEDAERRARSRDLGI